MTVGGFKFKPLWISAPVFCDPICYTLKQLQNPLQKLLVAEKDTKKFIKFKSFFLSYIMAERKRLMAKCQELDISLGSKTRLQVIKRCLNDLGVDWTVSSIPYQLHLLATWSTQRPRQTNSIPNS